MFMGIADYAQGNNDVADAHALTPIHQPIPPMHPLISHKITQAMPILLGIMALASTLAADTFVQSADFAASNAGNLYNGTGSTAVVSSGFFRCNMQPFDLSMGTLQSFTVKWEISGMLSGTAGPTGGNASVSFTNPAGGMFFTIADGIYDGGGGGNGNGAGPGQPFVVNLPATGTMVSDKTYAVSDSGVGYDPTILTALTGNSPFATAFTGGVTVNYGTVADLAASVTGKVTLTYTYEPPPSVSVTRIVRDVAQQSVTIEWTSTAGKTYEVDASNDLTGWAPVALAVSGATFTETSVPSSVTRRFYRVHQNN